MLNKEKQVEIVFNTEKCTQCGICAQDCAGGYLLYQDNKVIVNPSSTFGCIQCGHCMMSCPQDAIAVRGEGISENDIIRLDSNKTDYDRLYSLLVSRRSIREFKNQEVPHELIDKILRAASTGAVSIPPYEVKVLVIRGFDRVQDFAEDIVNSLQKMSKIMKPFLLKLLKPFIGNDNYKMFKDFVMPLINLTVEERKLGRDILFYNAPCVILFSSISSGNEDALISVALANTAADSLGLGGCFIGTVSPAINNSPKLKEKYGILSNEKVAAAFILGYTAKNFDKGIKRRFKEVRYMG